MSNLAVSGWEYLVNAPDGFWCVQLRSKEAGELSSRGERLGQNLYPAPAERTLDFNDFTPVSVTADGFSLVFGPKSRKMSERTEYLLG